MTAEQNVPAEAGIRKAFSIFIYPFFFRKDAYQLVLENILKDPAWQLEITDFSDEEEYRHLRYFYPYFRNFLFPAAFLKSEELSCFPAEKLFIKGDGMDETTAVRSGWRMGSVKKQIKILGSWQVIRWRWGIDRSTRFRQEFNFFGWSARFQKVSLLLFPTGVGLLLLEVTPEKKLGIAELREFNKKFTVLEEMAFGELKPAELEVSTGAETERVLLREVILKVFLGFLPDHLREEGSYASGEAMLHHYCFLCVDLKSDNDLQEVLNCFAENLAVFRRRTQFRGIDTRGWFTKMGASVVTGVSEGAGGPRPENLRRYWRTFYFDIFLHALYHRLSLLKFSWELSRIDELVANAGEVSRLHWRFFQFTNKAWFGHLTNAEYGNLIWKQWKEVMETEQLYEEVRVQLKELDDYLERKRRERNENLVRLLTCLGFPLSLVFGLFSANVFAVEGMRISLRTAAALAGAIIIPSILLMWHYFWNMARREAYSMYRHPGFLNRKKWLGAMKGFKRKVGDGGNVYRISS